MCICIFIRCDNLYECFGWFLICLYLVRFKILELMRVKGFFGYVYLDDYKMIYVYLRVDKYIVYVRMRIVYYWFGNWKDRSYGFWVMVIFLWGL